MIGLYAYSFLFVEVCMVKAFGITLGTMLTAIIFTAGLMLARKIGA